MRRIAWWLASTVTVVVLLFDYHTATDKTAASTPSAAPTASSPTPSTTRSSSSILKWTPGSEAIPARLRGRRR